MLLTSKENQTLLYYPVPKNANSSLKLFFIRHLGNEKDYLFLSDKAPEYTFRDLFQDILKKENKKNLITFFPLKQKFLKIEADEKCCIIRDPIKRFISAYKNRILYHKDIGFLNHTIDMIIEKLENNLFENSHFLPQTYFLGNDLNYFTIVANLSNINFFVDKVNDFFGKKHILSKIQTGGNDYKIELSKTHIKKIKKIYSSDYDLIRYNLK